MNRPLPLDTAHTILDCLEHYATVIPARRAYTFLVNGEDQERVLSYQELRQRARIFGLALRQCGLSEKAVLLLFPSGLDFIVAFFGCQYAGAVAVPANLARNSHHYARLRQIIHDSQAQATLTTSALRGSVQEGLLAAGVDTFEVPVLSEADVATTIPESFPLPLAEELAFLQYTSGSTGQPKGVMITHAQLMANERAIQRSASLPEHLVGGGWLPQFHDMGLIGTTLQPVALGGHYIFMSPLHFIQRPLRWLRMLSRYHCAATAAPNFALEMCAKAVLDESAEPLDLSALGTIFCGAEPVNALTVNKFEAKFGPLGLSTNAIKPCYGLAEATLIVSGGPPPGARTLSVNRSAVAVGRVERADAGVQAMTVVCCGTPVQDHVTVIVDPDGRRILEDNHVGEVWFGGPSVAAGYWRDPVATAATFQAMTACGQGPFMRTGDLGFLCEGGLYVTGRIKELMIVRGRNIYPHDIESTLVETASNFSEMRAAVFAGGADEATGVVAYLELPRRSRPEFAQDLPQVANALRQAVSQTHDLLLRDIYFVSHGTIPRTSSGKTQRNRCAAMYLTREIDTAVDTVFSTRQAT